MQLDKDLTNSNVVSLFSKKTEAAQPVAEQNDEEAFALVMKKNRDSEERLRQERAKANKAVLRSYRIKT